MKKALLGFTTVLILALVIGLAGCPDTPNAPDTGTPEPDKPEYGLSITGTEPVFVPHSAYQMPDVLKITVTNTGKQPLEDLAVTLTGAGRAQFTRSPASIAELAPGESTEIQITFPPLKPAAALYKATLKVTNDDLEELEDEDKELSLTFGVFDVVTDTGITFNESKTVPTLQTDTPPIKIASPNNTGKDWFSTNPAAAAITSAGDLTINGLGVTTIYYIADEDPLEVKGVDLTVRPPAALRFGVISDTHVGRTHDYAQEDRLNKVLDWYNRQDGVKALAIVGDITHNGTAAEWTKVKSSFDQHRGSLQLIAVMGNHDAYPSDKNAAADLFETNTGQKTNAHYVIDGYHFIVLNAGSGAFTDQGAAGGAIASGRSATAGVSTSNGDVGPPQSVRDWARAQITKARADAPGKPIFVFLHWPVQNTFYVSEEWYTSSLGTGNANYFFKDDPDVVIFGGHIHSPNNDPRSIWQGGFTSVNTVTLAYLEMEKGYLGRTNAAITTNPTRPTPPIAGNDAAAQGMIVSVDGSKVTIENYDFDVSNGVTNNVYQIADQTWSFDVSKPNDFPYTAARRTAQKKIPVFNPTAAANAAIPGKAKVKAKTADSVTVEFDQALIPLPNPGLEIVHSYRFDFYKSGALEKSVKNWSDFYFTPYLQKSTLEQYIGGLTAKTSYQLRIYAISSFQAEYNRTKAGTAREESSAQYLTVNFITN
ncbi:hypothetical protein FACS1894124_1860 [Spirochaetia bacterium]|nr:hypothetical protein FACS1894124_1860 [Spirochaetia bacterium]